MLLVYVDLILLITRLCKKFELFFFIHIHPKSDTYNSLSIYIYILKTLPFKYILQFILYYILYIYIYIYNMNCSIYLNGSVFKMPDQINM